MEVSHRRQPLHETTVEVHISNMTEEHHYHHHRSNNIASPRSAFDDYTLTLSYSEDTSFWQTNPCSEDELTDEVDSIADKTLVSSQEFRFVQEGQRLNPNEEIATATHFSLLRDDQESSPIPRTRRKLNHTNNMAKPTTESFSSVSLKESSVSQRPDQVYHDSSTSIFNTHTTDHKSNYDDDEDSLFSFDDSQSSDSTLPAVSPPASPEPTSKKPIKSRIKRVEKAWIDTSTTKSNQQNKGIKNTTKQESNYKAQPKNEKSSSKHSQGSVPRKSHKSVGDASIQSKRSHGSQSRFSYFSLLSRTTVSSEDFVDTNNNDKNLPTIQTNTTEEISSKMTPSFQRSCFHSNDPDSSQGTLWSKWQRQCESYVGPMFLDLWENYDTKDRSDDETLATYDDELSYEDEGNVNVLVAVQATVLGSGFPDALEIPNKTIPHVWGNNFVGMIQPPKGSTVHSRKFPPNCRVASICAWSAASHKPYIVCNSSHLLSVPPLDGVHLDATEVAVLVAAYLPAFQALHHGKREHPHLACEPTTLEGHRILILAHSSSSLNEDNNSPMNRSLVDAQVQAAVRLALWAGARDVHVTVPKVGNSKRHVFGNDYRVRLLDTPPDDWVPMLKDRMDVVLDYTGGFSLSGKESTLDTVQAVLAPKGRYVGCLGEDCSSRPLHCREEFSKEDQKASWTDTFSLWKGDYHCSTPGFLPESRDIRHVVEWTAMCMKMKRASLFDFHDSWKQDRRLAEHDFNFLLELLARRQIRPHVAKILDVDDFPTMTSSKQPQSFRSMSGAVVCEPWSQFRDMDDLSCCSELS